MAASWGYNIERDGSGGSGGSGCSEKAHEPDATSRHTQQGPTAEYEYGIFTQAQNIPEISTAQACSSAEAKIVEWIDY